MPTINYTYNGDGQRVQIDDGTNVRNLLWDGENVLQEYDASTGATQVTYTHEPAGYGRLISQHRGSTTRWYHFDALGSTRALSNDAGTATDTYVYRAFGKIEAQTGSTTNPFRWVGELGYYYDTEREAYHLRARAYSPTLGRFLSRDPARMSGPIALYVYVGNRPVTAVDPSGLVAVEVKFAAFIPLSKGFSVQNLPSRAPSDVRWGIEPGLFGAEIPSPLPDPIPQRMFNTDNRESPSWGGTSKIRSTTVRPIAENDLGKLSANVGYFVTESDTSYLIESVFVDGAVVYSGGFQTARSTPTKSEQIRNEISGRCKSCIIIEAAGGYPFLPSLFVANVDYSVRICLERVRRGAIHVTATGRHDLFPAYELIIRASMTEGVAGRLQKSIYSYATAESGPNLINLSRQTDFQAEAVVDENKGVL